MVRINLVVKVFFTRRVLYPNTQKFYSCSVEVFFSKPINNLDFSSKNKINPLTKKNNSGIVSFSIHDISPNKPVWFDFNIADSAIGESTTEADDNDTTVEPTMTPENTVYPTCSHDPNNNFVWSTCPLESNRDVWYGLSFNKENIYAATKYCAEMGPYDEETGESKSKLIRVKNIDTDKCIYDLLHWDNLDGDSKVLIGAYYEEFDGQYEWVTYNGSQQYLYAEDALDYQNFLVKSDAKPEQFAVAAYLGPNAKYFAEYGWVEVSSNDEYRYVCRVECTPSSANQFIPLILSIVVCIIY